MTKPKFTLLAGAILCTLSGTALADCNVAQDAPAQSVTDPETACFAFGTDVQTSGNHSFAMGMTAYALGDDSLAIGNYAMAKGNSAMALGRIAQATGDTAMAVGYWSLASGGLSLALGANTTSAGTTATAIGFHATAAGDQSISMGPYAAASATGAIALGTGSSSSEDNSVALGAGAAAAGSGSTALGSGASTQDVNTVAVGTSASASADSAVALGTAAKATGTNAVALGRSSAAAGVQSISEGYTANASGGYAIALGASSSSTALKTMSLGVGAVASADNAIAVGASSAASGYYSMSLGVSSQASGLNGIALGYLSSVSTAATNGVAIGYASRTVDGPQASYTAYGLAQTQNAFGVVSFGSVNNERILRNVAPGSLDTDAVNVAQLKTTRLIVDNTANAVSGILSKTNRIAVDNTYTDGAYVGGKGALAVGSEASAMADYAVAVGLDAEAQGSQAVAVGTGAWAYGVGATALGANAGGTDTPYANATSVGSYANAEAANATAVGAGAHVTKDHSVAIGDGVTASRGAQSYDGFLLSGQQSVGEVAVGNAGSYRQITGVAAGSEDNDAVNVAQLRTLDTRVTTLEGTSGALPATIAIDGTVAATATGMSVALGSGASATSSAVAVGPTASAADWGVAIGNSTTAATNAVAIGQGATTSAGGSVALGAHSKATGVAVVSVGDADTGLYRRIANVADGTSSTDAATLGQLQAVGATASGADSKATTAKAAADAAALAAGAATASLNAIAQTAVSYTDSNKTTLSLGDGSTPVRVTQVADGTSASDAINKGQLDRAVASSAASPLAMAYDDGAFGDVTLKGSTGTRISNLADGVGDHDASSMGQLRAVDSRLSSSIDDVRSTGQATAAAVSALGTAAVAYDAGNRARVTFGDTGTPVALSNVADGTAPTDAVNRSQLDAVAAQASTGTPLGVAYTDSSKADIRLSGTTGTLVHNVAAGVEDSDAANVGQLGAVRSNLETAMLSLGGGAGFGFDGAFIPPAYKLQGQTYRTVGDAFAAVDGGLDRNAASVTSLDSRLTSSLDGLSGSNSATTDAIRALSGRVDQLEKNPGSGTGTGGGVAVGSGGDGQATVADKTNGVAVGGSANAGGQDATAVGGNSHAAGAGDTAIGGGATVNADYSTAVGSQTRVAAVATHSVAVGANASVQKDHSVAVGEGSSATAQNAVALGSGSVADRDNTVSVGAVGSERAIANVAAGTASTDAANVGQVDAGTQRAIDAAQTYTDQRFTDMQTGIDRFARSVDARFHTVDRRLNGTGAMATAMSQMGTAAAGASGNGRIAAGVGYQGGERALAVGYATTLGESERVHFNFGGATTSTQKTVGAGVGVDL